MDRTIENRLIRQTDQLQRLLYMRLGRGAEIFIAEDDLVPQMRQIADQPFVADGPIGDEL